MLQSGEGIHLTTVHLLYLRKQIIKTSNSVFFKKIFEGKLMFAHGDKDFQLEKKVGSNT
jgi:hypothetical protein